MAPSPFASGPGWTVYHADAWELVPLLDPARDHLVTDPPYTSPPLKGSTSHARSRRTEYDAADPELIRRLVECSCSAVVITGSVARTQLILDRLPRPRRVLPVIRPFGVATKLDPWSMGVVLAHVFGLRDRAGRQLREGYFRLPPLADPRRHVAELPIALGQWLALGIPAGHRVVDPFAGSGALILGARRLGLDVMAGDLDERYCERIAHRLQLEPASLLPE